MRESLRERTESPSYGSAFGDRQRANVRRWQERSRADQSNQQQATSQWLRMQRVQQRQEEIRPFGSSGILDPYP